MPLRATLDGSVPRRKSSIINHNSLIVGIMAREKDMSTHDEVGVNGTGKRTFGQKFRRSCQRFWWIYLFVFIAIVLVVVLPMSVCPLLPGFVLTKRSIYVAYPKMAQSAVKDSELRATKESILNPAPDAFDLELTSELVAHSKYHPTLYAFEASLYLEGSDVPFASFTTPEMKATNGAVSNVQQRVQIQNQTEFTRYAGVTMASETYTVYLRGNGGLKQGGLPKTSVDYNQKIELNGRFLSEIRAVANHTQVSMG